MSKPQAPTEAEVQTLISSIYEQAGYTILPATASMALQDVQRVRNEPLTNPHGVKVGQIWGDCDPRMGGREFAIREIGETHATVIVTRSRNDVANNGRLVHRIKLTRFKPTSTGYRLIEDVK